MILKVKLTACTVLAYFYLVGFHDEFNSKAMPTYDTDYSCCIEVVELVNQSYGFHIIPHYAGSHS